VNSLDVRSAGAVVVISEMMFLAVSCIVQLEVSFDPGTFANIR
jgi:hypothetical protein